MPRRGEFNTFEQQFWPNVEFDPFGGCWLWAGVVKKTNGYPNIWLNGRTDGAHRASHMHFNGPIAEGFDIDHRCRVRCCVNPAHLEAVTKLENNTRSFVATGKRQCCPRGHAYTPENTGFQVRKGYRCRYCRECRRIYGRKWAKTRYRKAA